MGEFIRFEIIRNIKRKEFKVLAILLILCEVIMLSALHNKSLSEDVFYQENIIKPHEWFYMEPYLSENFSKEQIDKAYTDLDYEKKQYELIEYYKGEKDWRNMYLSAMEVECYNAQLFSVYDTERARKYNYYNRLDRVKAIQKEMNFRSIDEYKYMVPTDAGGLGGLAEIFTYARQNVSYFYDLYKGNHEPMSYSTVNSSTMLIQLTRNLLWFLIPLLTILLFYNDKVELHKKGIDKTLMTIPNMRKKYIRGKIIANSLLVIGLVFVPVIIGMCIMGMADHFADMSYPLLANEKGFTQFYFSYFDDGTMTSELTMKLCLETSRITNYALTYATHNMINNPNLDFIPMWKAILAVGTMFVSLIVLYVQMNMIFTNLFKNPYIGLAVNIAVILLLVYLSPIWTMNMWNMINPMTYRDPALNIMGTNYFPWIAGMLVTIAYNVILYIGNRIIFKKKYYR